MIRKGLGLAFYAYLKALFRHTFGINSSEALKQKLPVSGRM
jgi:hypothetical protein